MMKWEKGRAGKSKFPDPPPEIANICWQTKTNAPDPEGDPDSDPDTEGKPPFSAFAGMVLAIRPDIPDFFIRGKYFGKLQGANGIIRNPQFFAAQVASWWLERSEEKAAAEPKPHVPNYETPLEKRLREAGQ